MTTEGGWRPSNRRTGRLSTHALDVERDGRKVLNNVNLHIRPGELLCVLGPNGAGKSTLLSALAGELRPGSGDQITVNGRSIKNLRPDELARVRAVLPQSSAMQFDLQVGDIVAMGAYPFDGISTRALQALIERALGMAGVSNFAHRRYLQLSGGEQQRVQLARVILQCLAALQVQSQREYACGPVHGANPSKPSEPRRGWPSLSEFFGEPSGGSLEWLHPHRWLASSFDVFYLLLDEPVTALDPFHQRQLLKTVQRLTRQEPVGALVIVHDVNLAAVWGDRVALLKDGRILNCGSPSEVLTPAYLHELYGIKARIVAHPHHPGRPLVIYD